MDQRNLELAAGIVKPAYVKQGAQSLGKRAAYIRSLLAQRRLPQRGWPEHIIEALLRDLADMDSNNFEGSVGFGEREARIASPLVGWVVAWLLLLLPPTADPCRACPCLASSGGATALAPWPWNWSIWRHRSDSGELRCSGVGHWMFCSTCRSGQVSPCAPPSCTACLPALHCTAAESGWFVIDQQSPWV